MKRELTVKECENGWMVTDELGYVTVFTKAKDLMDFVLLTLRIPRDMV